MNVSAPPSIPNAQRMADVRTMEGNGPYGRKTTDLGPPVNRDDCSWLCVFGNESLFRDRIARFLAKDPATSPGGQPGSIAGKKVKRISVLSWRQLSANVGSIRDNPPQSPKKVHELIAHSVYHKKDGSKFSRDEIGTLHNFAFNGVTCAWQSYPDSTAIAIARFFKPIP